MNPRYKILEEDGSYAELDRICSIVRKGDWAIIARYGVNKTTLKKILNAYIRKH